MPYVTVTGRVSGIKTLPCGEDKRGSMLRFVLEDASRDGGAVGVVCFDEKKLAELTPPFFLEGGSYTFKSAYVTTRDGKFALKLNNMTDVHEVAPVQFERRYVTVAASKEISTGCTFVKGVLCALETTRSGERARLWDETGDVSLLFTGQWDGLKEKLEKACAVDGRAARDGSLFVDSIRVAEDASLLASWAGEAEKPSKRPRVEAADTVDLAAVAKLEAGTPVRIVGVVSGKSPCAPFKDRFRQVLTVVDRTMHSIEVACFSNASEQVAARVGATVTFPAKVNSFNTCSLTASAGDVAVLTDADEWSAWWASNAGADFVRLSIDTRGAPGAA